MLFGLVTCVVAVITHALAQSLPCTGSESVQGCGGDNGTFPWPVVCSYYPLEIDACYYAQTIGMVSECKENSSTNGSTACIVGQAPCKYTEYLANCCGAAQHAPKNVTVNVLLFVPNGSACPGS